MILNENPGIAIKTIAEGNPEIMGAVACAIPFASANPKRVLPSIMLGSAVAGVLYSFLKKDLKAA